MLTHHAGIQYAHDVVKDKVVACKNVKLACQRFIDDMERDDWQWRFCTKRADHVLKFMQQVIHHVKGPLANTPLKLEPWQVFALMNIYGWIDNDDTRRFQYVILLVARKNGKSLFASAMALYEMLFGEDGGEVYSLATKMDQAKIAWDGAVQMVNKAPDRVKKLFKTTTNNLNTVNKWTWYRPLGRDSKSLDGLNPSMCVFDEAAAYSDRNIVEVMTSATGARKNFMHLFITTAQFSKQTVYYENQMYMEGILQGKITDERWFGMLYSLDDGDDWTDPETWVKANPNLGVSIQPDFLQNEVNQATSMKSKRNGVLVKHMNLFTKGAEAWIDTAYWQQSVKPELERTGELFLGVDLSKSRDLTAVCRLWVNGDHYEYDVQHFLPESAMENVALPHQQLYRDAVESGILRLQPGDTVDYDEVQYFIEDQAKLPNFAGLGYDPYNAQQLMSNLEKQGINILQVNQGISYISPAAKETERLIVNKLIKHEGHPFVEWQLENAHHYTDIRDNITIRKGDDPNLKIDAIMALIMAISLAAGRLEEPKKFWFDTFEM